MVYRFSISARGIRRKENCNKWMFSRFLQLITTPANPKKETIVNGHVKHKICFSSYFIMSFFCYFFALANLRGNVEVGKGISYNVNTIIDLND